MRTSLFALVIALTTPMLAQSQSPLWETDYAVARQKAADQKKPVAVLFGKGPSGWQQLGGGSLSGEASRILAQRYVPCHIDTATADGQALARQFDLQGSVGLVISDRTGGLQAFWHEGVLSADALSGVLNKYTDPNRVAVTTDRTAPVVPVSNYPPSQPSAPAPFAPAPFAPGFGFPELFHRWAVGACRAGLDVRPSVPVREHWRTAYPDNP